MLYKVFGRTGKTDWVELNTFETQEEAYALASKVINNGAEAMVETHETAADHTIANSTK